MIVQMNISGRNCEKRTIGAKTYAFALHNSINPHDPNVNLQFEIVFYSREVVKLFKNLMTPGFTEPVNSMFLKYMGYETGHWALETKLIWNHLEDLVKSNTDFITLFSGTDELTTILGTELRNLLLKSYQAGGNIFTNKTRRLIKKCQKPWEKEK